MPAGGLEKVTGAAEQPVAIPKDALEVLAVGAGFRRFQQNVALLRGSCADEKPREKADGIFGLSNVLLASCLFEPLANAANARI